MSKVILDTNVLIYGLDPHSGFHSTAVSLLTDINYSLYIPTKVISEFFAVCSKLEIEESLIWSFYDEIKRNTSLLYPDPNSLNHFEELVKKYQPRGNRVFDIEIVSIALANNLTHIASANIGDFQMISEIQLMPITQT